MAITQVASVVTGQTYSAANFNTDVRDNINGIWVLTTAGDMLYATSSSAAGRLAAPASLGLMQNVPGGPPSWLTGGSALQVLRKNAGNNGYEWAVAKGLHAIGNVVFNPGGQSFNGSAGTYANITGATFNLTLSVTCTVVVFAAVVGYNPNSGNSFIVRATINSVADASSVFPFNGGQSRNEALPYIHYATGVTAGTRAVVLQCENSPTTNTVERGRMIALAFAE